MLRPQRTNPNLEIVITCKKCNESFSTEVLLNNYQQSSKILKGEESYVDDFLDVLYCVCPKCGEKNKIISKGIKKDSKIKNEK